MILADLHQVVSSAVGYFFALVVLKNIWEPLAVQFGQFLWHKGDELLNDALPNDPFKAYDGHAVEAIATYWNDRLWDQVQSEENDDDRKAGSDDPGCHSL